MGTVSEFADETIVELAQQQEKLDRKGKDINNFFEELLTKNNVSFCSVNVRTKSAKSLKEKIYRKNYFRKYKSGKELIADLSDSIGVRISCLLSEDENKIYEFLINNLSNESPVLGKYFLFEENRKIGLCRSKQPESQKNGFAIFRIDGIVLEDEQPIRFELQIKSLVHYLWGEVEHSLFYKKYDYIISNDYYAQLMRSINYELENVDRQICTLKGHMEQKDDNQSKNAREIAAYVLSRQFQGALTDEIGCNIDLREVFDVIVDLKFLFVTNPEDSLSKLNEFVQEISKQNEVKKYFTCIENGKLDEGGVASNYKDIACLIADNIEAGDIFWKALVTVYATNRKIDDFTEIINEMAMKLKKLVLSCSVDYDGIEDENISDLMVELTETALVNVICKVNKVGCFCVSTCLSHLRSELAIVGNMLQKKIVEVNNATIFEQNKEIIKQYILIVLFWACGEKIDSEMAVKMLNLLSNANAYQLCFDDRVIDWIRELGILDEEQMREFEELNMKEES